MGAGADQPLVPGRACGECTMCCTLPRIEVLDKPELTPCRHQHHGCTIYPDRPAPCREFFCGWRALPFVADHWYPPESGMMVFPMASEKRLTVHVDEARPHAWQQQPYAADLARWAVAARGMGIRLNVVVGREEVVVLAGG
jgi:hypothetical protein